MSAGAGSLPGEPAPSGGSGSSGGSPGASPESPPAEGADARLRVFAYGSLMVDGWEREFDGGRTEGARLSGYRRSFNKKSVRNWGTPASPSPTLGLEVEPGSECVGVAFSIPARHAGEARAYLRRREGPSFDLRPLPVTLPDGRTVSALVAVNDPDAESYIGDLPLEERAAMADDVAGEMGSGREYVESVAEELAAAGIRDPRVEEFLGAVRR